MAREGDAESGYLARVHEQTPQLWGLSAPITPETTQVRSPVSLGVPVKSASEMRDGDGGLVLVQRIGRAPAGTGFTRTRTYATPVGRGLRRKPAWVCSRRRHGRKGAEAALQRAKRSRRARSSSRGRRWHPTCPCHDRRPRSTRSSRGMAGFLASGTSVTEVEVRERTR